MQRPKKQALTDIDTSLKELGTDHLDIWYLHGKTKAGQITDELMEAQNIAEAAGQDSLRRRQQSLGSEGVFPAAIAKKHFDVILTSYNFTMDPAMEGLIQSRQRRRYRHRRHEGDGRRLSAD